MDIARIKVVMAEQARTKRGLPRFTHDEQITTAYNLGKREFKELLKEFFYLLEIEEQSDGGNFFHPNRIASCRAVDGQKLNEILMELKRRTNEPGNS